MDYTEFEAWLQKEKSLSIRSARDVICRVKRVQALIQVSDLDGRTLEVLNSNNKFNSFSKYIKSQLRRAVILSTEYSNRF